MSYFDEVLRAEQEAPPARYVVKICRALQCRQNFSDDVIAAAEEELCLYRGESSADGRFHLEIVHCFGHCTVGPNVAINDVIHNHTTPTALRCLLRELPP